MSAGEIPVNTSEITSATQLLEAAQRALHDRSLQKLIERDKVQEALNHIDNLLKIIGRLEEILGGKRKTYQSLIEEYNETNRIAIVQKTLQAFKDWDKEIEELERFVNSKPEIRVELQKKTQKKVETWISLQSYIHGLREIQKIIDKLEGDLVSISESEIEDINAIKHEYSAIDKMKESIEKAIASLAGSSEYHPDNSIKNLFRQILEGMRSLGELIKAEKTTINRQVRQEYLGELKTYKSAKSYGDEIDKQFTNIGKEIKKSTSGDTTARGRISGYITIILRKLTDEEREIAKIKKSIDNLLIPLTAVSEYATKIQDVAQIVKTLLLRLVTLLEAEES